jgi:hypothetical protein
MARYPRPFSRPETGQARSVLDSCWIHIEKRLGEHLNPTRNTKACIAFNCALKSPESGNTKVSKYQTIHLHDPNLHCQVRMGQQRLHHLSVLAHKSWADMYEKPVSCFYHCLALSFVPVRFCMQRKARKHYRVGQSSAARLHIFTN